MGDMRIVQEMYARGFEFEPIDIFRAQSRCSSAFFRLLGYSGSQSVEN